jgi:hypothetical protein
MSPSDEAEGCYVEIDVAAIEANPENDPEIARVLRLCKAIVNQKN